VKVFLNVNEKTTVTFLMLKPDLSIWDVTIHDWEMVTGTFTVYVGSSSRDLRLVGTFAV
jgi:beta-glucosidase